MKVVVELSGGLVVVSDRRQCVSGNSVGDWRDHREHLPLSSSVSMKRN